jgi:DNA integrity scanning protein DisA with diadenylate cyclase activity
MDNKQTQRKPVNSSEYKRVLNERVKNMNPLQIATFGTTLDVLQTIERFTHVDTVELNDVTKQITIISGLLIDTKWYDIELRRSYKQTLRGLIQRNNALVARLQTYSNDAKNTRDALDVLITTIKRG